MLIGRSAEIQKLKSALANREAGGIVVQGASGAGKTALIEAVLSQLSAGGTVVGRGKYAEENASGAFAPILQALSQAVGCALDLLYDPAAGVASLRTLLRSQAPLLASAGFDVLGALPTEAGTSSPARESAVQIIDAIERIFLWLDGFGVDVILFIDDWQRAPTETQAFFSLAAREKQRGRCNVIFAERRTTGEKGLSHIKDEVIVVGPLNGNDRAMLLEQALGNSGAGKAIADWLGASASGLPFDLLEAARAFDESGAIVSDGNGWQIDAGRAAFIDRDDFVHTLVRRMQALPQPVRKIGIALALWGDTVELRQIAEALDSSSEHIAAAAEALRDFGIILIADGIASFRHDRLKSALLDSVAQQVVVALADMMSERILNGGMQRTVALARTALRLRLKGGISGIQASIWRDHFVRGAVAAKIVADTVAARAFAEAALTLQEREISGDAAINILIAREALFASAMDGDVARVKKRSEALLSISSAPRQLYEAYESAIVCARMVGDLDLAWHWSIEAMRRLGVQLPKTAGLHHIVFSMVRWRIIIATTGLRLPKKTPDFDALSRLSNIAGLVAFERQPLLGLLIALRASARAHRLRLKDSVWPATDVFIHASFREYERAALLAAVALAQPSKFAEAATLYRALYFGLVWTRPLAGLRDRCIDIYNAAISEGDLATAALAVRNDALLAWRTEPTLTGLLESLSRNEDRAENLGDEQTIQAVRQFGAFARSLKEPATPSSNPGDGPETAAWLESMPIFGVEILAIRGEWEALAEIGRRLHSKRVTLNSHTGSIIWRFYENLARLRIGLRMLRGDMKFLARAASLNPTDHQCKIVLLQAELLRLEGRRTASLKQYSLAVRLASLLASRFEAGIIVESAALGVRRLGDDAAALHYEAVAQSIWRVWGATAKLSRAVESAPSEPGANTSRLLEAQVQADIAIRADRAKSRFLAEVGHELRTPLQAMQSLLDLAATGKTVDIGELRDAFGSFRGIVDDLTDLGALSGEAPLRPKALDLCELVKSEAAIFSVMAERKNLRFSLKMDERNGLFVLIDDTRTRQVLRNLLSNAVKYVDRGEIALNLSTRNLAGNAVSITITVDDTGPGLRDSDLMKLFEPFDRGGRDDSEGLGLGMALSRRIAERMDGSLTAENRQEGGARFILTFIAERAGPPPPPDEISSVKILLVEDIALNRRLIATQLRGSGHDVREAADGPEALAAFAGERFDVVILDLGLPGISGLDVLERMKAQTVGEAAVIVLTASSGADVNSRALEKGAADVLHKPVTALEMSQAIQRVVQHPRGSSKRENTNLMQGLEALTSEARTEMLARASYLIAIAQEGESDATASLAHSLAGLAAQFGEGNLAAAADALELACRTSGSRTAATAMMTEAVRDLHRPPHYGVSSQTAP